MMKNFNYTGIGVSQLMTQYRKDQMEVSNNHGKYKNFPMVKGQKNKNGDYSLTSLYGYFKRRNNYLRNAATQEAV